MAKYIPQSDSEFNTWQANFMAYAADNFAALGLTQAQYDALDPLQTSWETDYSAHTAAQDAAQAATGVKNESKSVFVAAIRDVAGQIQANPDVSDEARDAAGLPVHKTSRTPVAAPTTRPVVEVETPQRWQHLIHFRDENSLKKARPTGVSGCEIWVYVGEEAPSGPSAARFLGVDTRTPYLAQFEEDDGGKTAYYFLRWVNTRGEQGPWSETVEATIQG